MLGYTQEALPLELKLILLCFQDLLDGKQPEAILCSTGTDEELLILIVMTAHNIGSKKI